MQAFIALSIATTMLFGSFFVMLNYLRKDSRYYMKWYMPILALAMFSFGLMQGIQALN